MGVGDLLHTGEITCLFGMARSMPPCHNLRDRATVLGLGNILLSDEGAGVHAVITLNKRFSFFPAIDIIDGGTMGLDLLPVFQERDRILIIDAVDFGMCPGHLAMVPGDKIPAVLNTKLSVHHIGLTDLLYAARISCEQTPEICLVGIQPGSLNVGLDMTDPVRARLDSILEMTLQKLKEWGITARPSRASGVPKPSVAV